MSQWKPIDKTVWYRVFESGKVAHIVKVDGPPEMQYKAFYDGIFLGSHKHSDEAALASEMLSGEHE